MTMKLVSTVAIVLGAGSLLTACGVQQASAGCIVQDSPSWIAKYDLKPGQTITEACEPLLAPKGEPVGVFKFTDPDKENSSILTLRPAGIASRNARHIVPAGEQQPRLYAVGKLTDDTDENGFCVTSDMQTVAVDAASSSSEDATRISYQFEGVQVYSDPSAPGTQMKADLTYTRDGCSAEYSVRAMWPAIHCDPVLFADESKWTEDNAADRCGRGSFINPDFAVTCDPDLELCVPAKDIPSFK